MSRLLFDLLSVAAGIGLLAAGALLFNSAANAPYPRLRRYEGQLLLLAGIVLAGVAVADLR